METFSILKLKVKILSVAAGLGFMVLLPGMAFAQIKGQKEPVKKGKQLKEVTVTARVITEVQEVGPMKVRLNVINPTGKPVRISILNFENSPVYKTTFREKEFNKVLDFNSTVSGRYSLRVKGAKQKEETRRFAINNTEDRKMTESELQSMNSTDVMTRIYKSGPNKIMLLIANNTGKPVEYKIRDEAQGILYRGYVRDEQFSKNFDMSAVPNGKYTVEVQYQTDKLANRNFDLQTVYERSFAWTDKRGKPLDTAK